MKRVLLFVIAVVIFNPWAMARKKTPPPAADNEIHWITSMDELQAKMQQQPKKVYMDIYTNWCGWCKKMEATTFQNPNVIKYINRNFYAVRFDAERKDAFVFQGKEYHYEPQYKANTYAVELLKGRMGYPTSVFMLENFQNPNPVSSYLDVNQLETILTYFGDNIYKHQSWEEYQKTFKPSWADGQVQDRTPPPGH